MTTSQTGPPSTPQLHVRKFHSWDEFPSGHRAWDDLLEASSSPSAFLTREWLTSWWRTYGGLRELVILCCFNGDGALVAVATLYRQTIQALPGFSLRVLRLVGDGSHDSDNLDFIVRVGSEVQVVRALLDWFTSRRSDWDILELNTVPSDCPVAAALTRELAARRWAHIEEHTPHLVLPLPPTWDAYVHSLGKSRRSSIDSRVRRLQRRYEVRLRRCQTENELPEALERLFDLHNKRWQLRGEPGSFRSEPRRSFYHDVARQFLSRGWLDFWLLDLDRQTVAAEFGLRHGDTYSFLQGGFDPAYSSHSVGHVLRALILQQLIRDGVRRYDFLGGDDPHKLSWGAQEHRYYCARCAMARSRGAIYLRLVPLLEGGKKWLRRRTPTRLWIFLRSIYRKLSSRFRSVVTSGTGATGVGRTVKVG
jgi:CelD/BcsL family acetyltransferase involved in cellulose biosynthesis